MLGQRIQYASVQEASHILHKYLPEITINQSILFGVILCFHFVFSESPHPRRTQP